MDGLSRVGSYGLLPWAVPDYSEEGQGLAAATFWRGRRSDLTGLVYMGARYYDPGTGRFLSPDPLGHDSSASLYDYADGDPVNRLDPDGRLGKGLFGGAVKGDYYDPENTAQSVGQFLGQVGVGFTPAGILADIRDLSAAYRDVQNEGLSWSSGANLALGAVAVIPGVGDVVKGAGKVVLRTFTKNYRKSGPSTGSRGFQMLLRFISVSLEMPQKRHSLSLDLCRRSSGKRWRETSIGLRRAGMIPRLHPTCAALISPNR